MSGLLRYKTNSFLLAKTAGVRASMFCGSPSRSIPPCWFTEISQHRFSARDKTDSRLIMSPLPFAPGGVLYRAHGHKSMMVSGAAVPDCFCFRAHYFLSGTFPHRAHFRRLCRCSRLVQPCLIAFLIGHTLKPRRYWVVPLLPIQGGCRDKVSIERLFELVKVVTLGCVGGKSY